jgi:lysophospholipase L1-like esterase
MKTKRRPTFALRTSNLLGYLRNRKAIFVLAAAGLIYLPLVLALAVISSTHSGVASGADNRGAKRWIGTWAAAPQPPIPGSLQDFHNQTLRLIVHISAGGPKIRIKISNTFGDQPSVIGGAHIARRTTAAEIDPASDRTLMFNGHSRTTIPAGSMVVSDPVDLDVPALSDLAVSLFLPETTAATTLHILASQTSYVSTNTGDYAAAVKFPVANTIHSWPFLTGVDVEASSRGAAIVAFGSSLTDGDGSTLDTNRRWPDVLAERLQRSANQNVEVGVLNEGIIGNRLLNDSPQQPGFKYGPALGQAGLARFERDVLSQAGVEYVIVGLGINDIAFPGSLTPRSESVSTDSIISGYRQLILRAHRKGIRVIGTTNPPFEGSFLGEPPITFYTPEKEIVRQKVNAWILSSGEFDSVVDFDLVLRDPSHPTRILPAYDSDDHLHPNDDGCIAEGNAIPLVLFRTIKSMAITIRSYVGSGELTLL